MLKIKEFINNHPEISALTLLSVLCVVFLFWGLNFYPLIDVDETRYAIMSRDLSNSNDWNLLLLNSVPFLEKPPFYFWIVGFSIKVFGKFTEFAVRFPIALLASFLVFYTYFFGKRVLSRKFGLLSSIILLTSVFFLVLSHIAILDMVLTVWVASALYSGFLSFYTKDRLKKYCWWGFWTFIGLGFLAKGILAFAIPFTIMFLYCFFTKTLNELFKPVNMLLGLLIFILIALPWHYVMFQDYGWTFINEYFVKHHFARLLDSEGLGRKRSFFYFIPVFIVAFMPWTFVFIGCLTNGIKQLVKKFKEYEGTILQKILYLPHAENNYQKLVLFLSLFFIVVFGVMSISSTKLPTYILPALPASALLTGLFWCETEGGKHKTTITISTYILGSIFIIAALGASIAYIFLPTSIIELVDPFKYTVLIGCSLVGLLLIVKLGSNKSLSIFSGYVITMFFVVTFAVTNLFSLIYAGGENELVMFSNYASTNDSRLVTFDIAVKPSIKINHGKFVYFITERDFEALHQLVSDKTTPVYVIVKNKNVIRENYQDKIDKDLFLIKKGRRYSLYLNQDLPDKVKINPYIQE